MTKPIDLLFSKQKYLIGLAIFLALSAVSITVSNGEMKLNFSNSPLLMILLVLASIILVLIYIKIDQLRIKSLSEEILALTQQDNEEFKTLLLGLTSRESEIFQLIANGRSNKEIIAELFIEQSTLKTHINHIYKKLKVKSRKELKQRAKAE